MFNSSIMVNESMQLLRQQHLILQNISNNRATVAALYAAGNQLEVSIRNQEKQFDNIEVARMGSELMAEIAVIHDIVINDQEETFYKNRLNNVYKVKPSKKTNLRTIRVLKRELQNSPGPESHEKLAKMLKKTNMRRKKRQVDKAMRKERSRKLFENTY